jgi:hypothetical protein
MISHLLGKAYSKATAGGLFLLLGRKIGTGMYEKLLDDSGFVKFRT